MELSEKLALIIEEAQRYIKKNPPVYYGDPDKLTPEMIDQTIRMQDERAVHDEVIRILRSMP